MRLVSRVGMSWRGISYKGERRMKRHLGKLWSERQKDYKRYPK
jgi:hypothetical protein